MSGPGREIDDDLWGRIQRERDIAEALERKLAGQTLKIAGLEYQLEQARVRADTLHALNSVIDAIKPDGVPIHPNSPIIRALALMAAGDARMERAFKEILDALEDSEAKADDGSRGSQSVVREEDGHSGQGREGV